MIEGNPWAPAQQIWNEFITKHPELGYRDGFWPLHNFLRLHRGALIHADAIRKAKGRHWIAHRQRFVQAAFDCATGLCSVHVEEGVVT